jgi:DNA-binding MarR family transcriptional regulator
MTPRRSRKPETNPPIELDLAYFSRERPVGLLLSNLAAAYERAFLLGLTSVGAHATITAADHAILRCVLRGGATSTDIARRVCLTKQAVGKTVNALERRGFVARCRSENDQRAQVVTLTEKGVALVEQSIRVAKALDERTSEILGAWDLSQLKTLLVRVQEAGELLGKGVTGASQASSRPLDPA